MEDFYNNEFTSVDSNSYCLKKPPDYQEKYDFVKRNKNSNGEDIAHKGLARKKLANSKIKILTGHKPSNGTKF